MPIDPRELARFKHVQPAIIMHDRPCGRCGYNLKGLKSGSICPECGQPMPSQGNSNRLRDSLADAPLAYMRSLVFGLCTMMLGSIGGVIVLFLVPGSMLKAILLIAAGAIWWLGIVVVTAERSTGPNAARDNALDSARLRLINRILQTPWAIAGVGWMGIVSMTGPGAVPFIVAATVGPLIGLMGLVPLSIHLSAQADWAGDSALGDRFRATAWTITVCGILVLAGFLLQLVTTNLAGFLTLAFIGSVFILLIAQIVFVVCLLQLVMTVHSAIDSANFAHDRDRRRVERLRKGESGPERHCDNCGYDLAGLSLLTPCPECGHVDPEVRGSNLAAIAALRPKERKR